MLVVNTTFSHTWGAPPANGVDIEPDHPTFRLRKAVENALENSELGSRFRSRCAMACDGGASPQPSP